MCIAVLPFFREHDGWPRQSVGIVGTVHCRAALGTGILNVRSRFLQRVAELLDMRQEWVSSFYSCEKHCDQETAWENWN